MTCNTVHVRTDIMWKFFRAMWFKFSVTGGHVSMVLTHKGEKTIWGWILSFSLLTYLFWNIFTLFDQIQELIFSTILVNLGVLSLLF